MTNIKLSRLSKIILGITFCWLAFTPSYSQLFQTPGVDNTTVNIARQGRVGLGIPFTNFSAFDGSSGPYATANRVGFLVQGQNFNDVFNIGHLLTGNYGNENTGDVWTSIGGPGSQGISGLPLYGTRHQFDRYSVNMALADRNIIDGVAGSSGIRDAILFYDASPSNNSRMVLGKTLGAGRISPDIVINPDGNIGIGTFSPLPSRKLTVEGSAIFRSGNASSTLGFDVNLTAGSRTNRNGGSIVLRSGRGEDDEDAGNIQLITQIGGEQNGSIFLSSAQSIQLTPGVSGRNLLEGATFIDNLMMSSDLRLKTKVETMENMNLRLLQLKPSTYYYKETDQIKNRILTKRLQFGFIAQEVEKVFPNLVVTDEDGMKSMDYIGMIPVLVQALQKQQQDIDALTKLVAELTSPNSRTGLGDGSINAEQPDESSSQLFPNQPNPFDQQTTIRYTIAEDAEKAALYVYDMNGKQLANFDLDESGQVEIGSDRFIPGIYYYSLVVDGVEINTYKMILTE